MKFQVTLKDPDGFSEGLQEATERALNGVDGIDKEERESLMEIRREKIAQHWTRWVEYGEYVTLEFDTEAGTAVVVERKR